MCTCSELFIIYILDIDECNERPDICGVGFCINEVGTYRCDCPSGYMLLPNGSTNNAQYINNSYSRIIFVLMVGRHNYFASLLAEECVDMRKDNCFLNYTNGQCSVPMSNSQTRMICCCSMGQAWGLPCQPCPASSTSRSWHIIFSWTLLEND